MNHEEEPLMAVTEMFPHDEPAQMAQAVYNAGAAFARRYRDCDPEERHALLHASTDSVLYRAEMYCSMVARCEPTYVEVIIDLARELGRRTGLDDAERCVFRVAGIDETRPAVVDALNRVRGELKAARA